MREIRRLEADRDRLDLLARTQSGRLDQQAEVLAGHEKRIQGILEVADERTKFACRMREERAAALVEIEKLKKQNLALADRVAQQSQLLARAAEAKAESERRLGYLFPRGLETPPSREDALSPTWCREEPVAPTE